MEAQNPPGAPVDPRWAQVVARDRAVDGQFVYAVTTTGIYCRPSCPARRPLPKNVEFYETPIEAEASGYRPCERCRPSAPTDRRNELVASMCAHIDASVERWNLAPLATAVGLSASYAHRLFRSVIGLTPRQYAAEGRAARMRAELQAGKQVGRALYEAGYGAPSRLYESSDRSLGMTPSRYRAGGPLLTIAYAFGRCSLGIVLVARTELGICAVALGDTESDLLQELRGRFSRADLHGPEPGLTDEVATVVGHIERPEIPSSLPLDLRGSVFQKRVWALLCQIPAGSRATYKELAERMETPLGARAVARACATNPVAALIPCHRVVRSSGELAGYRWGVERKAELLAREEQNLNLKIPDTK